MRQKLSDLDRPRKEIEEERLNVKAFKELEESFYKALEKDTASWLSKGWGYVKMARQLSLIDQLPSVLAGLPTGVGAVKQFYRSCTKFLYNAFKDPLYLLELDWQWQMLRVLLKGHQRIVGRDASYIC